MAVLSGQRFGELHQAILDSYKSDSLEFVLRTQLEKRLDEIAAMDKTWPEIVTAVLEAAEDQGWTQDLIRNLYEYRLKDRGESDIELYVKDLFEKKSVQPQHAGLYEDADWDTLGKELRKELPVRPPFLPARRGKSTPWAAIAGAVTFLTAVLGLITAAIDFPPSTETPTATPTPTASMTPTRTQSTLTPTPMATATPTTLSVQIPSDLAIVFRGEDDVSLGGLCKDQLCGINITDTNKIRLIEKVDHFSSIMAAFSQDGSKLANYDNQDSRLSILTFDGDDIVGSRDAVSVKIGIGSSAVFDFAWSPRGDRIAYVVPTRNELRVVSADGRDNPGKLLTHIDTWLDSPPPAWSPSGSAIAIRGFNPNGNVQENILVVDADNTENTRWFKTAEGVESCLPDSAVHWSGDGTKIAIACAEPPAILKVAQYDGDRTFKTLFERNSGEIQSIAWAPDSSRIAFVYKNRNGDDSGVYVADTTEETPEAENVTAGLDFYSIQELVWRREAAGREAEYLAFADQGNPRSREARIYRVEVKEKDRESVHSHKVKTTPCIEGLQWSSNGRRIIYSQFQSQGEECDRAENQNIYMVDIDGSNPTNLTEDLHSVVGEYDLVAWFYDG
jgi:Tol biopolymer transport system component